MNGFIFPFGMVNITLQDIVIILDFPIMGDKIPTCHDDIDYNLGLESDWSNNGYT